MDSSSMGQSQINSNLPMKFAAGLGIVGSILILVLLFICCRRRAPRRRSRSNLIESFQQLYYTKTPEQPIKSLDQRVIERWSSLDQPSLTFYRVYIQDEPDEFYRPVTEERARSSIEQSKAMEYTGHEMIFF